ncbi:MULTISPECIES: efflux RND transporter periplasmic adaptor subunit [unclassified Beijerinckia]|uniref:efflux RND transporter periplasmic adaptor subunit n=1 Tax=unclassified Beijerinckia TaxID=2638183 RepID=UPI000898F492|nr:MULTISPECIES: efflux RND transporter periplasmic adaptor subunit [unclassified Beijerinckia]MDH7794748.1 multidrug efflux system membrane fusion protein [Beijerinckia sp. GAS462]SEB73683.1 RND family efflux transporter, MFP subunit [Beijerinckia sp. 28-YEA-48]
MKRPSVATTLTGVAVAVIASAVIWPGAANTIFPGAGDRGNALRAYLPSSLAGALPAYTSGASGGAIGVAQAQAPGSPGGRPATPVVTSKAARGAMPMVINSLGTAQPMATVALKTRVDAQIDKIGVSEGSLVKAGDVIARLDPRQIEAQIKQAEATLARDVAALDQANRDVARYTELLAKNAGTKINVDNARTAAATATANIAGDQAQIENLKVQLGWHTIAAPITGRVGMISAKAGNIVRSGDNTATGTLATIVQTAPIYVAFSLAQYLLPELRDSIGATGAEVLATPQGSNRTIKGRIAFVDNMIDPSTGTVSVRAVFENADEALWPGQLCNLRIVIRIDQDVVSIPREATQSGQTGNFVYVIENGAARVRAVKVARTQDGRDIIAEGLKGDETVVVEGALALSNGARVIIRNETGKTDS